MSLFGKGSSDNARQGHTLIAAPALSSMTGSRVMYEECQKVCKAAWFNPSDHANAHGVEHANLWMCVFPYLTLVNRLDKLQKAAVIFRRSHLHKIYGCSRMTASNVSHQMLQTGSLHLQQSLTTMRGVHAESSSSAISHADCGAAHADAMLIIQSKVKDSQDRELTFRCSALTCIEWYCSRQGYMHVQRPARPKHTSPIAL